MMKKKSVSWTLACRTLTCLAAFSVLTAVTFAGCAQATDETKSSDKAITLFKIGDAEGIINEDEKTIRVVVPYDAEDFTLAIEVSPKAWVSPKQSADLAGVSVYRVTAEDGSVQDYTVTVVQEGQDSISWSFPADEAGSINGGAPIVIYKTGGTSSVTLRLETAFTSSEWYVDAKLAGTGNSLTVYAGGYVPGTHYVSVEYYTGSRLYSKETVFTVRESQ